MRFQNVLHALHFEPWLITADFHAALCAIVESRLAAEFNAATAAPSLFGEPQKMTVADGIASIPIVGPIGKGLGALEKSCGATSVEDIQNNLAEAAGRADVRSILLAISSPGGTVTGIPETADMIGAVREKKPVVAFTDSMMASAAFWLGSQADMIVASKSANLGSIGVYLPYSDTSKQSEMSGVKVGIVKNSGADFKGMGHPGVPMTKEQIAHIQERVDAIAGLFKADIIKQRPSVKPEAMKGQTFMAAQAMEMGLVDQVGSYRDACVACANLAKMKRGV